MTYLIDQWICQLFQLDELNTSKWIALYIRTFTF